MELVEQNVPEAEGAELSPHQLQRADFEVYCQSTFIDVEIRPMYNLIDCDAATVIGKFEFRLKDSTSASLRVAGATGVINLTLDLQTQINSTEAITEPNILKSYVMTRFGERYEVNVLHYAQILDEVLENEFATFVFFFQQFCRFYETQGDQMAATVAAANKRQVNIVAKGAESTGFLLRQGLKGGGKTAGDMIRYIGQSSASASADPSSTEHEASSLLQSEQPRPSTHLTEQQIAAEEKRAEYIKQQAEIVHSYAKTATSAIMLPIRMMGRKAVELAQPGAEEEVGWKRAMMDTVGGCGNGIMSVAKGFTEVSVPFPSHFSLTHSHRGCKKWVKQLKR
jgi:hypothetical protein